MARENVYIKQVLLIRNVQSGRMEVKVETNHGRFHVAVEPTLVDAFYDHVTRVAKSDIEEILELEGLQAEQGEQHE